MNMRKNILLIIILLVIIMVLFISHLLINRYNNSYIGKPSHFVFMGIKYIDKPFWEDSLSNGNTESNILDYKESDEKDFYIGTPYMAYIIARTIFQYYYGDDYFYDFKIIDYNRKYWHVTGSRKVTSLDDKGGVPMAIIRKSDGKIVWLMHSK